MPMVGRKVGLLMAIVSADWPIPIDETLLEGLAIRLEGLRDSHTQELATIAQDADIWRYLTSYGGSPKAIKQYLEDARQDHLAGSALPFVIRTLSDGRLIGMTRLKQMSRQNRRAIVGSWLMPAAWGTGANTESKFLLLEYAFERLHCIRIEFHADSRNIRSREALTRMGAMEEGTLRSDLITREGHRRDTVIFSVLDREWPVVKSKLLERLRMQMQKIQPNMKDER